VPGLAYFYAKSAINRIHMIYRIQKVHLVNAVIPVHSFSELRIPITTDFEADA
jgi:hypothetical protein